MRFSADKRRSLRILRSYFVGWKQECGDAKRVREFQWCQLGKHYEDRTAAVFSAWKKFTLAQQYRRSNVCTNLRCTNFTAKK